MVDLVTKTYRPYLYIDLDFVMMDFLKHFRIKNYNKIIINDIHPLDINYEYINNNKKIRKFYLEALSECSMKFWLGVSISNVGNFYWKRLKEFHSQIIFITNTLSEEEYEYKKLWINAYLKTYDNLLLTNIDLVEYSRSQFYQNILITNDFNKCRIWSDSGGIGLLDLGKRSVASYYISKNIVTHFNQFQGIDLVAGVPDIRANRKRNPNSFDIKSITADDLYNI